ncbi:MAG: HNH endonuclease signature motif containing protein [Chloroflexota bacterium]
MIKLGDVVSYLEMCGAEGVNLQRGMNYHLRSNVSVILMSLRPNAPYPDKVEENGKILIYEGHDVPKTKDTPVPKIVDQPMQNPSGTLTQNGLFYQAAKAYNNSQQNKELVKVYEKLHPGIWVYNGVFTLIDAWQEKSGSRKVFKFKLELTSEIQPKKKTKDEWIELEHNRMIPPEIKLEVWKRDKGKCVKCGSADNLHFDHIIPFSKGGSSLTVDNIQLLCARYNIAKRDKIE